MNETPQKTSTMKLDLAGWLRCHILQDHNWTCAAEQGIKATPEQLNGGIEGFLDYATMYCARCEKVSGLSKAHRMTVPRTSVQ